MIRMKDLFTVKNHETLPYEYSNNNHITVRMEMNSDLIRIERSVYTVFDLLSDIGGITSILLSVFIVIDHLWSFASLENYIVQRLYKITKKQEDQEEGSSYFRRSSYFLPSLFPYFGDLLWSLKPSCCTCCKPNRTRRAMDIARFRLDQEINMIEFVKSRRYFKKALKFLLTKKKRKELKEKTRYIAVDPDSDKNEGLTRQITNKLRRNSIAGLQRSQTMREYSDGFVSSDTDPDDKWGGNDLPDVFSPEVLANNNLQGGWYPGRDRGEPEKP